MNNFENMNVLITGASGGIGKASLRRSLQQMLISFFLDLLEKKYL